MPDRRLPVRPNLTQLHNQAKDLLRALHRGDADAIAEYRAHHPESGDPSTAKLADAQLTLARSYSASTWARLVHACELIDAIWRDDIDAVMQMVTKNPELLHEHATIRDSNWGPPMTYAANLGRDRIIKMLHKLGANDGLWAIGRAVLQGQVATARMLHEMLGSPKPPGGALAGPAYTLNVAGTAFALEVGARLFGDDGVIDHNTMEHLLGTDSRNPPAKHRILEMYVEHGFEPPDTPVMALHRGRIDLLEAHFAGDPGLLTRTFDIKDVYPLAPACYAEPYTAQGTPVHMTTLLHLAVYFDELEIGEWLLNRGMNPDVRSAVDADGFGGYTPLFSTVVSQHNFWVNYGKGQPDKAEFTRLLLDRGADPNLRASIRHKREDGHGGGPLREYRDLTPLGWGREFQDQIFVSHESIRLIKERSGGP